MSVRPSSLTSLTASDLRLAELVAALSIATDLGSGQPIGHGQRASVIAARLGQSAGASDAERRDAYYLAMLRYVGCTADAHVVADVLGDELTASEWFATINQGQPSEALAALLRNIGSGLPPWQRIPMLVHALAGLPGLYRLGTAHCEVALNVTARLGLSQTLRDALPALMERWDGKGQPGRVRRNQIPLPVRLANLAQDLAVWLRVGGPTTAIATVRSRSGRAHDPALVDRLLSDPDVLLGLEEGASWDLALDSEPAPHSILAPNRLDVALEAIADFVDLKSPYLTGHSRGVARLVGQAADRIRLSPEERREVERAGLVHDLGRVAVTSAIWHKQGPLTDDERERVRLHPYQTERILARPRVLERLGALGSLHHERLDGSGYHRRAQGLHLSPAARLLGAADAFQAMTEPRPHRAALGQEQAAEQLRQEAHLGRLDPQCVDAVLGASGLTGTPRRRSWPANLSDREVEVLRLVARGLTHRQMAQQLSISPKTVSHHVEHIYDKIGVATRPGAALFAMQHDLIGQPAIES